MKKKIVMLFTVLGLLLSFNYFYVHNISYAQETQVYSWNDPKLYDGSLYGKVVTVEFTVVNSYNSGKACFLNAHSNWKKYFTAVIFRSDFGKFPNDPENYYYMKKVKVTGMLKEYQGKPEIILKSQLQVEIIK